MLTTSSWDPDGSHLPGKSQPEISSPEETHSRPGIVPSGHTRENKRPGPGMCIRCKAHLGQCTCQAPGHLNGLDLGKTQNTQLISSGSVLLQCNQELWKLRPGKCMKCRVHLEQCPSRAPWSLSSVDPGSTCHIGLWQTQCHPSTVSSPHMPAVFVCGHHCPLMAGQKLDTEETANRGIQNEKKKGEPHQK